MSSGETHFMKSSRSFAVAVVVASLALFAGACGGSDEDAKSSTTVAKTDSTAKDSSDSDRDSGSPDSTGSPESTEGGEDGDTGTGSVGDADFSSQMEKINSAIKSAGTDPCAISTAQNTEPPQPANATQVAKVVETYTLLLRSMAGSLPEKSSAAAKSLMKVADAVDKAAKDSDYDVEFFSSNALAKAMSDNGINEGISAFAQTTKGCPGSADMSGTSPKG